MKKKFKRWLLAFPGFEGLCRVLTSRHVRALMYHRFSEHATGDPRRIDPHTLSLQVRHLARHHTFWDPDRHLQAVVGGPWPGGRCPVVVTVDDGYADFATVAHPVFREHGIPIMLFVATDFVDGTTWFWWDKLEYVLARAASCVTSVLVEDESLAVDLMSPASRTAAWHAIADRGRFVPDQEKEALVARVAEGLGVALPAGPPAEYAAVTWEQISIMAAAGTLFGAHTRRHPILSRVPLDEAEQEIRGSREHLVERLGQPVMWFSYPQGGPADWTPAVRELVAKRFRGCYLAYPTLDDPVDPYALPRYGVTGDMAEFRWTLCGAEYLILRLRRCLGLPTGVGRAYWAGHAPAAGSDAGGAARSVPPTAKREEPF